jgi:isopentenyl-diphosphate delta-isomerase
MQDERVGLDHLHSPPALVQPEAVVELHRADIGEDEGMGRGAADLVGGREGRVEDGRALRTDANRQPECFGGLAARIATICAAFARDGVPVIAKEVGWGIAPETARRLWDAGVTAIDVAGAGGTSWSQVEAHRAPDAALRHVAEAFRGWGIPTAESLRMVREAGVPDGCHVFASGGLRSGVDLAKAVALGATLGGIARPFLEAAAVSGEEAMAAGRQLIAELRISMFCIGASDLPALRATPHLYEVAS